MNSHEIGQYRYFLKDSIRKKIDFRQTDQNRGLVVPPFEKPYEEQDVLVDLVPQNSWTTIPPLSLEEAIDRRESRRVYKPEALSKEELSFLLWSTQGIKKIQHNTSTIRTVPSAGARHSFETYLFIWNIEDIEKGLYRYLPLENKLLYIGATDDTVASSLSNTCLGQSFVSKCAVTFVWTTIPYRMEWRYSLAAHRVILIDAGHMCQNLYLACEAIHAGTCAVGAYDQEAIDHLLGVDGENEFVIYLAPVGKG